MPESTIRVLRDDCSCTENLVGILSVEIHVEMRSFIFFVYEALFEKENNPCRSSLSQKFFFSELLFFKWRQNLLLYHMYHFSKSMMRTKSTRALCFSSSSSSSVLGTSYFAGQNDQLRLKSSKAVLKAFQLIFPWLKMK